MIFGPQGKTAWHATPTRVLLVNCVRAGAQALAREIDAWQRGVDVAECAADGADRRALLELKREASAVESWKENWDKIMPKFISRIAV